MCQSCGMPIRKYGIRGTEKDGSKSDKYCVNCYRKGEFAWPGATAEQMQIYCMSILTTEKHWPAFLARMATSSIPKLDRWHKA
jgi:hypothetical protein